MFSVPDILVVSVLALLLFGPDRLPKIMRQAGRFMREIQSTSQSFVSEMERAADVSEHPMPPVHDDVPDPASGEHDYASEHDEVAEPEAAPEHEVIVDREEPVEEPLVTPPPGAAKA